MGKMSTKYKGLEIEFLDGEVYVLPKASVRVMIYVQKKVKEDLAFFESLENVADLVLESFRMNYPAIQKDYILDNLDSDSLKRCADFTATGKDPETESKEEELKKK